MGVIWDSKDAESVKGRGISGTPVDGARLVQSRGQMLWTPQQNLVLVEDFAKTATGVNGTAGIGELNWTPYFSAGAVADSYFNAPYTGGDWGLVAMSTTNVADNGVGLRLTGGSPFALSATDFRLQLRAKLAQTDAAFDAVIGFSTSITLIPGGTPLGTGIVVEKNGADASWYGACYKAGAKSRTTALGALTTNYACFEIRLVSSGVIGFKMASTFSGLAAAAELTVSTNVPTTAMDIVISIATRTTAVKQIYVDFVQLIIPGMSRG